MDKTSSKKTLAQLPDARVFRCVLCGLSVYPRVDIAFFPSKVSSYAVGGESPFPPFVADGAFGDSEYRGDIACREQAVGTA
jgi:hypothetical protein